VKKSIFILGMSSVLLFAGKNVELSSVAPVDVNPAPAVSSNALALKVGTLGVGVDIEHMFNKKFGMRFNLNGLKITKDKSIKGIEYNLTAKLLTAGLLADYHPWESNFRLSAGLYYDGNKFTGCAKPTLSKDIKLGDKTYTVSDDIRVSAKIDWKKFAPYAGIGWSSTEVDGWHFSADIGVMYIGKPKVNINAISGGVVPQSELDTESRKQEIKTYNEIKKYKFYPVVMLGVQKKF